MKQQPATNQFIIARIASAVFVADTTTTIVDTTATDIATVTALLTIAIAIVITIEVTALRVDVARSYRRDGI